MSKFRQSSFFCARYKRLWDDAIGDGLVEQGCQLRFLFSGQDLGGEQGAVSIACKDGWDCGLN